MEKRFSLPLFSNACVRTPSPPKLSVANRKRKTKIRHRPRNLLASCADVICVQARLPLARMEAVDSRRQFVVGGEVCCCRKSGVWRTPVTSNLESQAGNALLER